jgi:hypothetical protein
MNIRVTKLAAVLLCGSSLAFFANIVAFAETTPGNSGRLDIYQISPVQKTAPIQPDRKRGVVTQKQKRRSM